MIEYETADKLRLGRGAMLHLHYFNHVQVYGFPEIFQIYSSRYMRIQKGRKILNRPLGGGAWIVRTASTTSAASFLASTEFIFVARDV
jgi:hypothetical protein